MGVASCPWRVFTSQLKEEGFEAGQQLLTATPAQKLSACTLHLNKAIVRSSCSQAQLHNRHFLLGLRI